MTTCSRCYGRGHIPTPGTERTDYRDAYMAKPMTCPDCAGSGDLNLLTTDNPASVVGQTLRRQFPDSDIDEDELKRWGDYCVRKDQ